MATPEGARRRKIRARDVFESYFLRHHREDLTEILEEEDVDKQYPVFVNFLTMFEEHMEVAESLLTSPSKLLPVLDLALFRAATNLLEGLKEGREGRDGLSMKTNLHARITGLPSCPELYRDRMPRTADEGRLLCVAGTVVRRTSAKMLQYQKEFLCAKCKHVFTVVADHDQYYHLDMPGRCPNPTECYSSHFTMLTAASRPIHTKDYQELKIQEQVQKLKMGSIPGSMWVTLEDDLVDSCRPGDDVMVCGVVRCRWRPLVRDARPTLDLVLRANNVTVDKKDVSSSTITEEVRDEVDEFWHKHQHTPLTGRNIILASLCPEVYGLYVVKLALAVVVAGGVQKTGSTTTRIRGEAHLLLVGDPGTAKSQFLKYASHLVPRSVFTSGSGTSSTGLTVTVVRDEGDWALEAGALVMADGGVCCIDEFSTMKEADRAAIHEAMEQQTISVAKAGLLCKLDSRCSVLAATNPKEESSSEDALEMTGLASPLLSRFDLVLLLADLRNQEWDRLVSHYILNGQDPGEVEGTPGEEDWGLEKLRAYFCIIRSLQPRMTPGANEVLRRYYQVQRQSEQRSKARTTLRLLESLVRLSQGHARLLMREEVGVQDAVVAISLLEASLGGFSALMSINPLYTAFPVDVEQEYRTQVQVILEKLGLLETLKKEMARLDEEEHLANKRRLSGTSKKRDQTPITSTQKLPSSVVFQARKDFRPTVSEETAGLDIEELRETTDQRKRPRGSQQSLNKWVEPEKRQIESSVQPEDDDFLDDDLEFVKPKKRKSRKEEVAGKGTQTQVKDKKGKKNRKKGKEVNAMNTRTDASPPPSISHVDKAGEELLNDLDEFTDETRRSNDARENFISAIAKFAYQKPGKHTNTKRIGDKETPRDDENETEDVTDRPEPARKKTDGNLRKAPSGLNKHRDSTKQSPLRKTMPAKVFDVTEQRRQRNDITNRSQTGGENEIGNDESKTKIREEAENVTESPPVNDPKNQKTTIRDSTIAKLRRFSFSPPEDRTVRIGRDVTSEVDRVDGGSAHVDHGRNREDGRKRSEERRKGKNEENWHSEGKRESEENYGCESKDEEIDKRKSEQVEENHKRKIGEENHERRSKEQNHERRSEEGNHKRRSKEQNHERRSEEQNHERRSEENHERRSEEQNRERRSKEQNHERRSEEQNRERRSEEQNHERRSEEQNPKKRSEEENHERREQNHNRNNEENRVRSEQNRNNRKQEQNNNKNTRENPYVAPSSSSSFSFSSHIPLKPKLKHKRSSFSLNEEIEDEDLFASPVSQKVKINKTSNNGKLTSHLPITTTTTTTTSPSPFPFLLPSPPPHASPSPILGRIKLPVASKADKYKALASDELDDFDFDL